MKRTVLHFIDTSTFGGEEQVVLTILGTLDRSQWDPVLAYHPSPGLAPLAQMAREMDIPQRPVPALPGHVSAGTMVQFARLLRREKPSIIHVHLNGPLSCKYALFSAGLMRVPAVVATAHLFTDLPDRLSIRVQQRLVAAQVDCYIAVSHDVARKLVHTLGTPPSRLRVVPNCIPLAHARERSTHTPGCVAPAGRPMVLTVARLEEQKGLEHLVEAAALIPDVVFVIAGEGSRRAPLEARAQALGVHDRLVFLGYRQDVPDLLACCTVFVLPSLFEGLPLAVLEAMGAGRPVVATRIGGTDEIITDGYTGLLVPPRDSVALARAIRRVLSDTDLARRLGKAGQRRALYEFSAERMAAQVTHIYDELLHSHEMHA